MSKYQKIVVSGLLIIDGKVLVIRRSPKEKFLTGYYELPGGKVDFGEQPKQGLEREFREEVNLEIEVKYPFNAWTYISDESKRHTVEIDYKVELKDDINNLKLSESHDDFKWIGIEELDDLKISDEVKNVIRKGGSL